MMQNAQNKSQKYFDGPSMTDKQTDRQTDEVHVEITRKGLAHSCPNSITSKPATH